MLSVLWFRRDLRLEDHRALKRAFDESSELLLLFQVNPSQFLKNSPNHNAFFQSVAYFQKEVNKTMHLQILYGDVMESFKRLKEKFPTWGKIYFNQDMHGFGKERDQQMIAFFKEQQIAVEACFDHYLHGANEIKNQSGDFYKIFTPYYNQWIQREKATPIQVTIKAENVIAQQLFPEDEEKFRQLIYSLPNKNAELVGSRAAMKRFENFLLRDLADYQTARDFPIKNQTSKLSPYLRTGEISIRTIWHLLEKQPYSDGKATFMKELGWRDFYQMIYVANPNQKEEPIQKQFAYIHWDNHPTNFEHWKNGTTGYPIVDAAMRQLKDTGWMHNRLRMIVASFLTKDLLIDWRWGERYFQQMLIDYDSASNIGGWQWAASTGTDAVPYFRIFNPTTQSKKFDPTGDFIRLFIPELKAVPNAFIHEPQKMTQGEQKEYGVFIGKQYPKAIVDHQKARQKAIARYEESKAVFQESLRDFH